MGLCDVESVVFRVEEGRILDDLEEGFVVIVIFRVDRVLDTMEASDEGLDSFEVFHDLLV